MDHSTTAHHPLPTPQYPRQQALIHHQQQQQQHQQQQHHPQHQHQQAHRPLHQQQHSTSPRLQSHRSQAHAFPPPTHHSYVSPQSPHQHTPSQQYQSPLVASTPGLPHQHPAGDPPFYGAHPSPYSAQSAAPSYASSASEQGDSMAANAVMSRHQHYPPISSYHTPQSNSPASIQSPQTDAHGRPLYQLSSMPQQMYYPPNYALQHSSYPQHSSASFHPSIPSAPPPIMTFPQPPQHQHQHQQQLQQPHPQPPQPMVQHQHQHQQQPNPPQPALLDTKPPLASLQRPAPVISPSQMTPQTPTTQGPTSGAAGLPPSVPGANSNAAPGPIPATTPLVVRQDRNGVQWIAFEYSRDRIKMEYTIRCDVESVNTDELSQDFKSANCVYPRACCGKDQYKGNRLHYESECNTVGWALAQLNPPLREKRGLIQRAVDSWRNSNQDVRLRSRRVRRMAKVQTRKSSSHMGAPDPASQQQQPMPPSLPNVGQQTAQVPADYVATPAHHHQPPLKREDGSVATPSSTPRTAQQFYPTYPIPPHPGVGGMPPMQSPMHPPHSTMSTAASDNDEAETGQKRRLFGDVPEVKRRKFILVDDGQHNTRVRVRVSLDQVKMDDMPDAHLQNNSVYPRSYFPRQTMQDELCGESPGWDDDDDEAEGIAGSMPTRGRTTVPTNFPMMDGSQDEMPIPRLSKGRRNREMALNEIGYRMSWGQARTFNRRPLFLQRSLDAYRNKMRSTMLTSGQDVSVIAPHFETRIAKQWRLNHIQANAEADSP